MILSYCDIVLLIIGELEVFSGRNQFAPPFSETPSMIWSSIPDKYHLHSKESHTDKFYSVLRYKRYKNPGPSRGKKLSGTKQTIFSNIRCCLIKCNCTSLGLMTCLRSHPQPTTHDHIKSFYQEQEKRSWSLICWSWRDPCRQLS